MITIFIVLKSMMIASADYSNVSLYESKNFSPTCIITCTAMCKGKGWQTPICLAKCLLNCKDTPTVSNDVRVCTSTCAQSTCSKFIDSGNKKIYSIIFSINMCVCTVNLFLIGLTYIYVCVIFYVMMKSL